MAAEVFLFVLIGATVNINYLSNVGIKAFVVIVHGITQHNIIPTMKMAIILNI